MHINSAMHCTLTLQCVAQWQCNALNISKTASDRLDTVSCHDPLFDTVHHSAVPLSLPTPSRRDNWQFSLQCYAVLKVKILECGVQCTAVQYIWGRVSSRSSLHHHKLITVTQLPILTCDQLHYTTSHYTTLHYNTFIVQHALDWTVSVSSFFQCTMFFAAYILCFCIVFETHIYCVPLAGQDWQWHWLRLLLLHHW